ELVGVYVLESDCGCKVVEISVSGSITYSIVLVALCQHNKVGFIVRILLKQTNGQMSCMLFGIIIKRFLWIDSNGLKNNRALSLIGNQNIDGMDRYYK
ncbi:24788_t:CDS:2, partial [Gigaspora rosea]